jgi:hypothetical protein
MEFLKRLLGKKEKPKYESMHGVGELQTKEEQDATRTKMESEMTAARELRTGQPPAEPPSNP